MLGEDEEADTDDLDDALDLDVDDDTETVAADVPAIDRECRRKLEDALERRRLEKEIQDYDFDID